MLVIEGYANIVKGPSLSSTKISTKSTLAGEYQPIMLTAAKPANRPKGTPSAQEDNAYFDDDTNEGTPASSETTSSTRAHKESQDLETIAREAGLSDAAVSYS